ncbi:MAG: hypothetical protein MHMPM18_001109 [Marteilia pararefringens]
MEASSAAKSNSIQPNTTIGLDPDEEREQLEKKFTNRYNEHLDAEYQAQVRRAAKWHRVTPIVDIRGKRIILDSEFIDN